jgi:hypothetical protein
MPTVGFFGDYYFFVPNSFFTAGFFDRYGFLLLTLPQMLALKRSCF